MRRRLPPGLALVVIAAIVGEGIGAARAQPMPTMRLETNQSYVEQVTRPGSLMIDDPMAVFAFVFGSLPDRVKVYPTENFYYFGFVHDGKNYAGNLRLDARSRDQGKITFVYYEETTDWDEGRDLAEKLLGEADGIKVEAQGPLTYRIAYGQKSVLFELNDLSEVKPPAAILRPDETFIGPVFDESGVRFFLVFNSRLKVFSYLLDETVKVADELMAMKRTDRILVGKRTAFAFYRDHRVDRKILIGVFEGNARRNNFLDGPFDQMPDNFHVGDTFRQALHAADPYLKGKIDRFGAFPDGARYAIVPYMQYRKANDLTVFHRCATSKSVPATDYDRCFVLPPGSAPGPGARPLAMQGRSR